MAYFRFDSGPRAGQRIALDKPKITFGRQSTCDCVLKHPTVSRQHFFIERAGNKFLVVDSSSGNGTFANGERITWAELKDGDKVKAGPFSFTVELSADKGPGGANDRESAGGGNRQPESFSSNDDSFNRGHERDYPREYLQGIVHFNAGRYFEAHEEWEEVWLRSSGDMKLFYQMLIQAAVGLHHFENGNARGVGGMYRAVMEKAPRLPSIFMSLDVADFTRQFGAYVGSLIDSEPQGPPAQKRERPIIRLIKGHEESF
jgi:hypothetical protein